MKKRTSGDGTQSGSGSTKYHSKAVKAYYIVARREYCCCTTLKALVLRKRSGSSRVDGSYDGIIAMLIWDLRCID